jgi:hypothetical protein
MVAPSAPIWILLIAGVIGVPLGLLIAAFFLRSACDLCEVSAPRWGKALLIVVLLGIVGAGVGGGLTLAAAAVTGRLATPSWVTQTIATGASLFAQCLISATLYIPLLRVRFRTGIAIWLWQLLMSTVLWGLTVLLLIGGWTLVDGVRKLV